MCGGANESAIFVPPQEEGESSLLHGNANTSALTFGSGDTGMHNSNVLFLFLFFAQSFGNQPPPFYTGTKSRERGSKFPPPLNGNPESAGFMQGVCGGAIVM